MDSVTLRPADGLAQHDQVLPAVRRRQPLDQLAGQAGRAHHPHPQHHEPAGPDPGSTVVWSVVIANPPFPVVPRTRLLPRGPGDPSACWRRPGHVRRTARLPTPSAGGPATATPVPGEAGAAAGGRRRAPPRGSTLARAAHGRALRGRALSPPVAA